MKGSGAFPLVLVALIVGACAPVVPVPTTVDTDVPSGVESHGLYARVDVLRSDEVDVLFGRDASARMAVLELKVENRERMRVSIERESIRLVTPDRQDMNAMSPFGVANLTRPGPAMISSGNNAVDAVLLILGLVNLAQNYEASAKWKYLMPETFEVAAGEERRTLLAFSSPDWAPGTSRIELPFKAGSGALPLTIPLTFKAVER